MKLICIGDSLTFGFGISHSIRWTTLVAQQTGCQIINRGINGDTTGGMLARLQHDVLDCAGPDRSQWLNCRVLVMGGSNDIFYSGTDSYARANLGTICQQLLGRGLLPLVGIPLPIDWEHAPVQWAQAVNFPLAARCMADYQLWLRSFCSAFGLTYIDFAQDFLLPNLQPRSELFWDGLHPNAEGHRLMARRLLSSVSLQPL